MPNLSSRIYYRYDEYFKNISGKITQDSKKVSKNLLRIPTYQEPKSQKKYSDKIQALIDSLSSQFALGTRYIEIYTDKPFLFRKSLHKCVRRRGLLWNFAITENSVFVVNS